MIKPTIGRIVWYWPHMDMIQPFAAQICFVHSDTLVNLAYHNRLGDSGGVELVPLYQGDGEKPVSNYCEWMSYQHAKQAESDAEKHPRIFGVLCDNGKAGEEPVYSVRNT